MNVTVLSTHKKSPSYLKLFAQYKERWPKASAEAVRLMVLLALPDKPKGAA
jgi:hypothetical protein